MNTKQWIVLSVNKPFLPSFILPPTHSLSINVVGIYSREWMWHRYCCKIAPIASQTPTFNRSWMGLSWFIPLCPLPRQTPEEGHPLCVIHRTHIHLHPFSDWHLNLCVISPPTLCTQRVLLQYKSISNANNSITTTESNISKCGSLVSNHSSIRHSFGCHILSLGSPLSPSLLQNIGICTTYPMAGKRTQFVYFLTHCTRLIKWHGI